MDGKYEHQANEGLTEFLIGLGLPSVFAHELASRSDATGAAMEITTHKNNAFTIKTAYPTKEVILNFTIGQEFDDPMPNGDVLKSVASINNGKLVIVSKKDGAVVGGRTMEFNKTHCIITITASVTDKSAKVIFRRV